MISTDKIVIICGDFNLRYQNETSHFIIQELLNMNFTQQIDHPTHINGGIIDHLYLYWPEDYEDVIITWEFIGPFYADHFGISVRINQGKNLFRKIRSSIPDELIAANASQMQNTNRQKKQKIETVATKRKASSPKLVPKTRQKHE